MTAKRRCNWLKFQFPFWWTNLLTALDTLFWLGFSRDDDDIARGLGWYRNTNPPMGCGRPDTVLEKGQRKPSLGWAGSLPYVEKLL